MVPATDVIAVLKVVLKGVWFLGAGVAGGRGRCTVQKDWGSLVPQGWCWRI